jgi:hypothetical protein
MLHGTSDFADSCEHGIDLRVPLKVDNFLTSLVTVSFFAHHPVYITLGCDVGFWAVTFSGATRTKLYTSPGLRHIGLWYRPN